MFRDIKEILRYKELIRNLVVRDLKVRYKRSLLWLLWAFLEPVMLMALFTAVFSLLLRIKVDNYPAFVICGIIAWNFFTTGVSYSLPSVSGNAGLVKKIYFPKAILPVATVIGRLVNFALSLLLLVFFLVLFRVPMSVNVLYLPVIVLLQVTLILGLSLLLTGLNTLYDDVNFLLNFVFFGMFYLTPVFYSVDMVPERFRSLYMLNPMAIIITSYRDVLLYSRAPRPEYLAVGFAFSGALLLAGFLVFRRLEKVFAEVL